MASTLVGLFDSPYAQAATFHRATRSASAVLMSIFVDVAVQLNMWRVSGQPGAAARRRRDPLGGHRHPGRPGCRASAGRPGC
jgi:hypothetical protein